VGRRAGERADWRPFRREASARAPGDGARTAAATRGFQLRAEHWGKGLATEAARAVIDHAFGPLGAGELFAGHHPQNFGSQHVLEKLGFRYTHDELYPATGLQHRSYRLTLDEYRKVPPPGGHKA
jgi:RimJ/RimL family protein N-acetyltransferase